MLTQQENEYLTQVGPGTPGGDLLRRYWHPIALAQDLSDENPTKFVRVLGEDLVLCRDKSGNTGLIAGKCPHRNASMVYGRVEERGISCAYHGWLMDCEGNIIETPPERNDAIMKNVKTTAYPLQIFLSMIWTYMGPTPVPPMTRYDTLFRKDGHRDIRLHPVLDCNWLQAMENSMDPAHLQVLHQEFIGGGRSPVNTTRGYTDDVESFEFYVTEFGLMKKRTYKNGTVDEHPLVFPSILRQGASTQFRTPIDDTHTWHVHINFHPTADGSEPEDAFEPKIEDMGPYKQSPEAMHPQAHFTMHHVIPQDHMAWETQGPLADRSIEHLSYSDRGVVLLRRVLKEQIEKVQRGEDPLGVQRGENPPMINTNIDEDWFAKGFRQAMAEKPAAG
ncbi:MAG: aromatic ring-hydroxylating dioxygenase subunit alpha [Chloroflexi bacterium]|nr:aromatic ring-hydroxylating dioxygenase subunit alpha [Chloroflexota bacterium]